MEKINVFIVDDEELAVEGLQIILRENFKDVNVLGAETNIEEAAKKIIKTDPDLILLDIDLGEKSGFELLDNLLKDQYEVIFITAHKQHAVKAFKYSAVDYVLKPVSIEDLRQAIDKVKLKFEQADVKSVQAPVNANALLKSKVAISDKEGYKYVELEDIVRFEADGSYCTALLTSGKKLVVSKPLNHFALLLDPNLFYRVHRSHLINAHYIKEYKKGDGGWVILENDDKIPIADSKRHIVSKKLLI